MREGEIVLVLSCNSGEVQGLFCKNVSAREVSSSWAISVWARVHAALRGSRGRIRLSFHKELEIVFNIIFEQIFDKSY